MVFADVVEREGLAQSESTAIRGGAERSAISRIFHFIVPIAFRSVE